MKKKYENITNYNNHTDTLWFGGTVGQSKKMKNTQTIKTIKQKKETRNSKVLADFIAYCKAHPTERFWQALRNWAEVDYVLVAENQAEMEIDWDSAEDTFYWERKNK